MNILFLTMGVIDDIDTSHLYTDLMRKFKYEGHNVFIASPLERRYGIRTYLKKQGNVNILRIWTLNLQKTNSYEKAVGMMLVEYQFYFAIKKYFSKYKFDLILYTTPPVTFSYVVGKLKKEHTAVSYLLLKDIFPQNAVDLGVIKKNSLIYKYFRKKETDLYKVSDYIGCMSEANVSFLIKHNPNIDSHAVEVNPNSIEPTESGITSNEVVEIRSRYGLPKEKTIFIYGGNLGIAQGVDFIIEILEANKKNERTFFLIVGSGTEYPKIKKWFGLNQPQNSMLLPLMPKKEYDNLLKACDVGLIFLDSHFTIPNYPSRLLSYLEHKKPVIAATDINTDIGRHSQENGFGFWCTSGDLKSFNEKIDILTENRNMISTMGNTGHEYLLKNFTVDRSYSIIMKHFN